MSSGERANPQRFEAGHRWMTLRKQNDWIQKDVTEETRKLDDGDFVVEVSQLSRIEKGDHKRVSLDDAAALGAVFGLSPVEIFQMYGVPVHPKYLHDQTSNDRPQALVQAEQALLELPLPLREALIRRIQLEVMDIRQLSNELYGEQPEPKTRKKHPTEPPAAGQPILRKPRNW